MNFQNVAMIVGTVAALSVGQVLFKLASDTLDFGNPSTYFSLPLISALTVYGIATMAWLVILSKVPLSSAFPFYGLSFFFVPVLSALFLGERLRLSTIVGAVVIAVGIIICSRDFDS
ncbi:MAG TPA: EamA family transporter [Rhodocyclaceae bacterium]|nr:EamA family transporter [Rhodocyclaceae bacterium]